MKIPLQRSFHTIFAPQILLSDENMQKAASKFAQMKSVMAPSTLPAKKNAAVLIPLCVIDEQVALLYTLRAANLKSHKGQVSFPGGMEDAGDKNAEETALRETKEELGIEQGRIQVWGQGSVVVSRGVTSVLPVIGVIKSENVFKELRINRNEVKEVFAVPLHVLCAPENIRHTQFRASYSLPVFVGGKRKIWGLTAIITHFFLKALLPRDVYNPNIRHIPPLKRVL